MAIEIINPKTGTKKNVCGANRKDGSICMASPMPNGRCVFHGGKSPRGIDHPHFVHGRYSKYLPRNLLTKYIEAQEDDDLYSLRPEISLLDARIASLVEQLTMGDGSKFIEDIEKLLMTLQGFILVDEEDRTEEDLKVISDKLTGVLSEAKNERRRWQEIYDVIDNRRKLVESDRKRELEAQKYITEKQAQLMMQVIISVIRNNVDDPNILRRISTELDGLSALSIERKSWD